MGRPLIARLLALGEFNRNCFAWPDQWTWLQRHHLVRWRGPFVGPWLAVHYLCQQRPHDRNPGLGHVSRKRWLRGHLVVAQALGDGLLCPAGTVKEGGWADSSRRIARNRATGSGVYITSNVLR